MAESDEGSRTPLRTRLFRWGLALVIGLGGAYLAKRVVERIQARSQTRVLLTDFARFHGCLFGLPSPRDADAPDRVLALAEGTGDPLWPHSCALALTRMEHTADEIAADDSSARPLADAVRAMEAQLGEAVFWTEHVQEGRVEPPQWVAAFVSLRRVVNDFARARGASLPAPEAPRRVRVPRPPGSSEAPIRAVPLPGGEGADLLSVIATPTEFAVGLRDASSHYTICRWPVEHGAAIQCRPYAVPNFVDPRYAGFVPSERWAHLAVWARAWRSLRGLVDLRTNSLVLVAAGDPDATRDFWIGPQHDFAIQIDSHGPTLLVGENGPHREVPLPAGLDVLTEARALLGTPHGALEVWLDARVASRTELRGVALGLEADPPGPVQTFATFRAPRMTGTDRRVVPCSVAGARDFLLAGDMHGSTVFVTDDGTRLVRGPDADGALDAQVQVACDRQGVVLVRRESDGLAWIHCSAETCTPHAAVEAAGNAAVGTIEGALLIGDGAGEPARLRFRRVEPDGSVHTATFSSEAPPARAVLLALRGDEVALFAAADESVAFRSDDGGRTFAPAVVQR